MRIIIEFFQALPKEVHQEWTQILNEIWKTGIIPESCKRTIICPIFKAGNEEEVKNYRGVSLLNVGYKILGSIINSRLRNWLERK